MDVMEAYAKATAGGAAGGDTVPSTAGPGLAAFCGLTPHWTLFSPDRVGRWAFGGQASSDTVTCETSRGMLKISPRQYTKAALAAQPHAVEMLSGAPQQPPDADAMCDRGILEEDPVKRREWLEKAVTRRECA